MAFAVHPVTPDRIDDFVAVANPTRRASHCWCLSHRLTAGEIAASGSREEAFRALCGRANPPGVIGYDDGEPVGWCSIGPRAENTEPSRPQPAERRTTSSATRAAATTSGHRGSAR